MSGKVIIVGAGPGGLTAGMILAGNGFDVQIYEKEPYVGGRNGHITIGDYTFDIGPTFLMMKDILEEMFELAGTKLENHLDVKQIDPMYRLSYANGKEFFPSSKDHEKTKAQIKELFPGNENGFDRMIEYERKKYSKLVPCLQVPYEKMYHMVSPRLLKAMPYLDATTSLFKHLGKYFTDDDLRVAFTFQAKYLGMSPWECPGTFSIISYIEHDGGIWHPIGGLNRISHAMADVVHKNGGKVHLNKTVKELIVENGTAKGIRLENGEEKRSDYVFVNADFAHSVTNLVEQKDLKKWNKNKIDKSLFSCSTFMLYLGVDKVYDNIPHHSINFAENYEQNVHEIAVSKVLSDDPSFYVQNASVTDPTLAPEGKSTIYVLVPVPNNRSNIDWEKETPAFREKILNLMETRGKLTDIRKHIEVEKIITPLDWEKEYNVYNGATFNLAHNISQMLVFRPHNRFEDIKNCYLVGGGTHPGSGLPTIYESGRISANYLLGKN